LKAWRLSTPGGELEFRDVAVPLVRSGTVLVRMEAVPVLTYLGQFITEKLPTYRPAGIYPGHGKAAGLELISQTRTYLRNFADAIKSSDAKTAEQHMLTKYPEYHVKQFLTTFSIPAYYPSAP